jgi:hypothetical protein
MRHRGFLLPESDEVVVEFRGGGGNARPEESINWGGGGGARDDLLQPLLATAPPSRSGQQSRSHLGLHTRHDNTPAIVKLSGIRAGLMQE